MHGKYALGTSQDSPSDPKIAYPLGTHPFDIMVSNIGKNKEKRLKKTHVIQKKDYPHIQEFHHLHTKCSYLHIEFY